MNLQPLMYTHKGLSVSPISLSTNHGRERRGEGTLAHLQRVRMKERAIREGGERHCLILQWAVAGAPRRPDQKRLQRSKRIGSWIHTGNDALLIFLFGGPHVHGPTQQGASNASPRPEPNAYPSLPPT